MFDRHRCWSPSHLLTTPFAPGDPCAGLSTTIIGTTDVLVLLTASRSVTQG
jgi:hypothetical protein